MGQGKYIGTVVKHFKILPIDISKYKNTYIDYLDHNDNYIVYTGEKLKPLDNKFFFIIIGIDDEGDEIEHKLEHGKDFTTKYKNNINTGTAEITITGINNYTGKFTKKFIIDPEHIYNIECKISINEEQIYSGEKKEPVLNIVLTNGKRLILGQDYEVEYKDNISAGKGIIIIKGINNYDDSMQVYFEIKPKNFETMGNNLKISIPNQEYTGKKLQPKITVKDGKTELKLDTDYTVSYKNNTNVGTATVTITGKGNYTGTINKTFKIQKDISKFTVEGISNKTYAGKAIKLSIKVKDGKTELKLDTDYTVSYKNNTNVGTATVTITGKGNYKGTITKTFKIVKK